LLSDVAVVHDGQGIVSSRRKRNTKNARSVFVRTVRRFTRRIGRS